MIAWIRQKDIKRFELVLRRPRNDEPKINVWYWVKVINVDGMEYSLALPLGFDKENKEALIVMARDFIGGTTDSNAWVEVQTI